MSSLALDGNKFEKENFEFEAVEKATENHFTIFQKGE